LIQNQFIDNGISYSRITSSSGIPLLIVSGIGESQILQLQIFSSTLSTLNYNSNILIVGMDVSVNNSSNYVKIAGLLNSAKQSYQSVDSTNTSGPNSNTVTPFSPPLFGDTQPYLNINQATDVLSSLGVFSGGTSGKVKQYQIAFASISNNRNNMVGTIVTQRGQSWNNGASGLINLL
jgi:hypothetical protein